MWLLSQRLEATPLPALDALSVLARGLHAGPSSMSDAPSADRMSLVVGPASAALGSAVCAALSVPAAPYTYRAFPDGEVHVEMMESVRGKDVFILQSTSPPVELHLLELLLLADSCRRAGAVRLTALIPYFGYARQDRRTNRGSLGARVAADIIATGHFDRVMLVDAHTPAIEGFLDAPLDHLTAVPVLAQAAARDVRESSVVVAPDLGAVKLARAYAGLLDLPMAFVHKTRLDGEAVQAHGVIGDVRARRPIIVDDMLSTGGTIEAALGALRSAGALEPATVVVTHALFVGHARDTLRNLPIARIVASDTVAVQPTPDPRLEITSVGPLIATAVWRTHRGESLVGLRRPG